MPRPKGLTAGKRPLVAKTCRKCGQLKTVHEYGFDTKGYRQSDCDTCRVADSNVTKLKANMDSQKAAHKWRQPWTNADIKQLDELTKQGLKAKEIGERMGRSISSIYTARDVYLVKGI